MKKKIKKPSLGDLIKIIHVLQPDFDSAQNIFAIQKRLLNHDAVLEFKPIKPGFYLIPLIQYKAIPLAYALELAKLGSGDIKSLFPVKIKYVNLVFKKKSVVINIETEQNISEKIIEIIDELFGAKQFGPMPEKRLQLTVGFYKQLKDGIVPDKISAEFNDIFPWEEEVNGVECYQEIKNPVSLTKFEHERKRRI